MLFYQNLENDIQTFNRKFLEEFHFQPSTFYFLWKCLIITRGGSRTTATSKMECFVITVNGFQSLTIITKRSILDVAVVLDPPLITKILRYYKKFSLKSHAGTILQKKQECKLHSFHKN